MDVLVNLLAGFSTILTVEALFFCFVGVTIGTFVGVLPGIGAIATIAMCLPLTFHLDPTIAIIMLAGIFYGSQYGGSTASILLNIPGSPSSAVVCLDGYPMSRQGKAGQALFITSISSFIGGTIGILLLMFFGTALASLALKFHSADYFSVMVMALVACSFMSGGSFAKGLAMVVLGVSIGLIGTDVTTGQYRFTFGRLELTDGIGIVALATGLFGVGELLLSLHRKHKHTIPARSITLRSIVPTADQLRRSVMPTLRGSAVGSWLGALPGAGPTISSFMAYALEKRAAKDKSKFGKGAVEGIAAPEAANNAAVQAAFIPTLSLGIPGDAMMAVLLGAMILHGITPGPQFIAHNPQMFWGLVASFWIGNILLLILNIPFIGVWVRILAIPYKVLYPCILFFICIGVYSVNNNIFDLFLTIGFGIFGYFMMRFNYPIVPILLGFVLGPMIEENFRRAMLVSGADPLIFIARPLSASFLLLSLIILLLPLLPQAKRYLRPRKEPV